RLAMLEQWFEKAPACFPLSLRRIASDPYPGFDEGCDQPWPDGPLVVDRIAVGRTAPIHRIVGLIARRKRAESERCQQHVLHCVHDSISTFLIEQVQRQAANGKDLIRAERVIPRA